MTRVEMLEALNQTTEGLIHLREASEKIEAEIDRLTDLVEKVTEALRVIE